MVLFNVISFAYATLEKDLKYDRNQKVVIKHINMYACIPKHTYVHTHTHKCMHTRTHACTHARTHTHTPAHTRARAHTRVLCSLNCYIFTLVLNAGY